MMIMIYAYQQRLRCNILQFTVISVFIRKFGQLMAALISALKFCFDVWLSSFE